MVIECDLFASLNGEIFCLVKWSCQKNRVRALSVPSVSSQWTFEVLHMRSKVILAFSDFWVWMRNFLKMLKHICGWSVLKQKCHFHICINVDVAYVFAFPHCFFSCETWAFWRRSLKWINLKTLFVKAEVFKNDGLVMRCILHSYVQYLYLYGIVVPAVHFNTIPKDKCYFVQSSYYIPVVERIFTRNCSPAAKDEEKTFLMSMKSDNSHIINVASFAQIMQKPCIFQSWSS